MRTWKDRSVKLFYAGDDLAYIRIERDDRIDAYEASIPSQWRICEVCDAMVNAGLAKVDLGPKGWEVWQERSASRSPQERETGEVSDD